MNNASARPLVIALMLLSALNFPLSNLWAQGTAFTYQGRLNDRGAAANGTYDFRFTMHDRATGGTSAFAPVTADRVAVSNGLFTVGLDFGALGSTPRWLEIEVQLRAGGGGYVVLSPRQSLSAAPRAHYALQAGDILNPVPDALIPSSIPRLGGSNVFTGQVGFVVPPRSEGPPFTVNTTAHVPNLNADYLDGLDSGVFWKTIGNADTSPDFHFLGTTDNQPLELRANNERALRIEPNTRGAPNVVAGSPLNFVGAGAYGSTIAGGGARSHPSLGAGTNDIRGNFGFIGGGFRNHIGTNGNSVIAGGNANRIGDFADSAVIAGGFANRIEFEGNSSVIGGGFLNTIDANANLSVIAGGQRHWVMPNASYAMIAGGSDNRVSASYTFAAGANAHALHPGAFVWADATGAIFSSTSNNQFSVRASGGLRLSPETSLFFGSGAKLWPNQGGAIELGNSLESGVIPYIDFHYGTGSAQDFNVRLINDANGQLTLSGNQQITGTLGFGFQTRQMLNLWGAVYGIGVQGATMYFRTDAAAPSGGFAWYKGGTHSDAQNNPGGGSTLMRLDGSGNLNILGGFGNLSDRNAKENFERVNARDVLEKVVALPLTKWNYKHDTSARHLGPMAQDFHAAFGVGSDDRHITTVDADGVALAAIQGLHQKLEQKESEIAGLKARLGALEKIVANLAQKETQP